MATFKYLKQRDQGGSGSTEEVEYGTLDLSLSRNIYQQLGDLTANKSLTRPTIITNEFDRWITAMDDYASGAIEPTQAFKDLDEYLGTLGLTREYPFKKDGYSIEPWVDIDGQEPTRNVSTFDVNLQVEDNVVYGGDNVIYVTGSYNG